jgi:hypothetical protein
MRKELTFDEMIMCFTMMQEGNNFGEILSKLDPTITEENLYYLQQRVHYHKRTSKEKISVVEATLIVIKEEKIDNVIVALALFGYCNFRLGAEHIEMRNKRRDDIVANALDKLADDLGGRADVIKINFDRNENKPNRPPDGKHDTATNTGEGKGD